MRTSRHLKHVVSVGLAVAVSAATMQSAASSHRETECARYARAQTAHLDGDHVDTAIGAGVGLAGGLLFSGLTSGLSGGTAALIGGGVGAGWGYHHGGAYAYHYRRAYFSCLRG